MVIPPSKYQSLLGNVYNRCEEKMRSNKGILRVCYNTHYKETLVRPCLSYSSFTNSQHTTHTNGG